MKITLPWPDPRLFPNAKRRLHWSKYRRPAKDAREYAWAMALKAGAKGRITVVSFHPPDRRHRDDDGMIGAFKHYRDGIADATGVDDKHYRPTYTFGHPVKGGRIDVIVGSAE